jgi:type IV pilus assembly protein PilX
MTNIRKISFEARRESGAILVTSMLLLLVLTVLAIAMMRMTGMQERMAGNTRDLGLAFQGAEAALRGGERYIASLAAAPVWQTALPCSPSRICNENVLPLELGNPEVFDWEADAFAIDEDIDGLSVDPSYVIEKAGFVRDSLLFDETGGRDFYRVTGRSTGASGLANSVLQSTYARRF